MLLHLTSLFGLAALLEDFGHAHLRRLLDLFVAVEKLPVDAGGDPAPHRGLAGAHHAHEHHRPAGEPLGKFLGAGLPRCRVGSVHAGAP